MSLIERGKMIELAYSRIDGIDRLYGQTTPDASDWEYAIDNVPTVDAVPVVRCGECKHHDAVSLNCEFLAATTLDNWYCWNGERREESGT